jgi:hypothetical protein
MERLGGSASGWPDWAKVRPMGDCLLWAVIWKLYIQWLSLWINLEWKNGLGYILGDFFTNSSGHPGLRSNVELLVAECQNVEKVLNMLTFLKPSWQPPARAKCPAHV